MVSVNGRRKPSGAVGCLTLYFSYQIAVTGRHFCRSLSDEGDGLAREAFRANNTCWVYSVGGGLFLSFHDHVEFDRKGRSQRGSNGATIRGKGKERP